MSKKEISEKFWTKKRIWKKKKKHEENLEPKREYEKYRYEENPGLKREYEKNKHEKNFGPRREYEKIQIWRKPWSNKRMWKKK